MQGTGEIEGERRVQERGRKQTNTKLFIGLPLHKPLYNSLCYPKTESFAQRDKCQVEKAPSR